MITQSDLKVNIDITKYSDPRDLLEKTRKTWGCDAVVSVPALHAGGRVFDPRLLHFFDWLKNVF